MKESKPDWKTLARLILARGEFCIRTLAGLAKYKFAFVSGGSVAVTWRNGGGHLSEEFPSVAELAAALSRNRFDSVWRFGLPRQLTRPVVNPEDDN